MHIYIDINVYFQIELIAKDLNIVIKINCVSWTTLHSKKKRAAQLQLHRVYVYAAIVVVHISSFR